jgi:hypothetical protein
VQRAASVRANFDHIADISKMVYERMAAIFTGLLGTFNSKLKIPVLDITENPR